MTALKDRTYPAPKALIEEARRRQRLRRAWLAGLAAVAGAAAVAALTLGFGGGGTGAATPNGPGGNVMHRIHVGALTVSAPAGWHSVIEPGGYYQPTRTCTLPISRLALASYRLPAGFGKDEGSATVVPADGILLGIDSVPIRRVARPWTRWRLSNRELRPVRNVLGPDRFAAVVQLPRSRAASAWAWFGSIPAPRPVLAAANRILRSVRINQDYGYGCQ